MYQKRNKELTILNLYLKDFQAEYYLREISKITKIPLKTTQDCLKLLENKGILRSSMHGKNRYFSLNLYNIITKYHLMMAEIYNTELFIDKYPLIKLFLKEIYNDTPLIVFGSYAKFQARKDSDFDLLIIGKKIEIPSHVLPYKLHRIEISPSSLKKLLKQQETFIKEVEQSHVIINNHSYYINMMWDFYARK